MCPSKGRVVKGNSILGFLILTFFFSIEWSVLWNSRVLCCFRWCSMWQNRLHSHFLWDNLLRLCSLGSVQRRVCRSGQRLDGTCSKARSVRAHRSDFILCFILPKHSAYAPFCENKGFPQRILTK